MCNFTYLNSVHDISPKQTAFPRFNDLCLKLSSERVNHESLSLLCYSRSTTTQQISVAKQKWKTVFR